MVNLSIDNAALITEIDCYNFYRCSAIIDMALLFGEKK